MLPSHWSEISSDPNNNDVLAYRRGRLNSALSHQVKRRNDHLVALASEKRVLDIGCADHLAAGVTSSPLHRRLAQSARELVGVDLLAETVSSLRVEGFDVHVGDVTKPGLVDVVGDSFDLVVAGEIIEHLLDMSTFFENAKQVLSPTGDLVLTTPNPHSIKLARRNIVGRPMDSADHVTYHWPSGMAEIADRCGFDLMAIHGCQDHSRRQFLTYGMARALARAFPHSNMNCTTLIYVLRPRPLSNPASTES